MADEKLDYDALTDEISKEETSPERLVEIRKELEGVEFAGRNDDHTFVYNELMEKAQKKIDDLAATPLDNLSADQLDSLKNLVNEFSSHIQGEYSGTAATLMKNIDARYAVLEQEATTASTAETTEEKEDTAGTPATEEEKTAETPTAEGNTTETPTTEGNTAEEATPEVSAKDAEAEELADIEFLEGMRTTLLRDNGDELEQFAQDNYGKGFNDLTVDETKDAIRGVLGNQGYDIEQLRETWNGLEPEQRGDFAQIVADADKEILDDKDAAFLDSITDENKAEIVARYNRLEEAADELGDVFNQNYTVGEHGFDFKGLQSFFDNVYIDADIPENPEEEPSKKLRKDREWFKDATQTLAMNLALKDLVQDGSIDEIKDKEKLKERLAEAVHDNMVFLSYNLVSTQHGFETLAQGQDLSKMSTKDRQEFITMLHNKSNGVQQAVTGVLAGTDKAAIKLSSAAITSTYAPYHNETESFARGFKEKTGIGKLLNRVKSFDEKMTKNHPTLWPVAKSFAKTTAIRAVGGLPAVGVYVGISTFKQYKKLYQDYKQQKAESNGEMKLWDFVKKNPGKIAAATLTAASTGLAEYAGIGAAFAGNFGAVGNVAGALLSGEGIQAAGQLASLSLENIANAGKGLVKSIANTQNMDLQSVADGIKNSWSPTRISMSVANIGVGVVKSAEAFQNAEKGHKWSAAKKAFVGTFTGMLAGAALADATNAAEQTLQENIAYEHMKQEIEASEKAFQQELENSDFSDIKIPLPPDYTVEGGEIPEVTVTGHAHQPQPAPHNIEAINLEGIQPVRLTPEPTLNGPENIEVKQVYNVNGEQVAVAQGETLEDTLDSARQEYLDNHPEIDDAKNKVEIEGNGVEATIKTEKEDIMANDGEGVIGQETEIDRKIEVGNVEIKDHIEKTVTDTGKAEMQESTGRVDYNSNNNIPDGAKVTGAYHFENDNQKLNITSYEVDGKTYVTDGTSTRELPEGQSIEKMYQTANAMLKETAEVSYQESQQQAEEKEQESPSPKPKPRILEGNSDITAEEIKMPEGHHTQNNNDANSNESDEDSKNKANSGATASQEQEQPTAPVPEVKHNDMVIENGEEKPIYRTDIYKNLMNGGAEGKDTALNELIIETDGHGLMVQPRPNEDCLLKEIEINGEKMITIDAVAREDGSGKAAIIAYSNLEGTKAGLIFLEDGMNGKFSILEHKLGEEIHASDTLMEGKNAAESLKFSNLSQETTGEQQGVDQVAEPQVVTVHRTGPIPSIGENYDTADGKPPVATPEVSNVAEPQVVTVHRTGPAPSIGENYGTADGKPPVATPEVSNVAEPQVVTVHRTGPAPSLGGNYGTADGKPPVATPEVVEATSEELTDAEKIAKLRNGISLQQQGEDASSATNTNVQTNSDEIEMDMNLNMDMSLDNGELTFDSVNNFIKQTQDDFTTTIINNENDFNNTIAANQAEFNQTTVDGIVAAGGQDYSADIKNMGVNNSQILYANVGEYSREVTNGDTVTTTQIAHQTEFRQGNNGFAMVNNDQVRTVTVEGKNLHFQISENGHVRDMTANEAQQFCNDVKATGAKTEGFNNKLFNSVEGIKHVNDSRGVSSYAPEPRGNSGGGNVNTQTLGKGGRDGM